MTKATIKPKPTGFQPMRIHKRVVISWLESHPEDAAQLLPEEWQGRLQEYLDAMRRHSGEWIVDGQFVAPGDGEKTAQVEMNATMQAWASQVSVSIPRYSLERAVHHLDKIEGLALIRAAYGCNVQEAQEVRDAMVCVGRRA